VVAWAGDRGKPWLQRNARSSSARSSAYAASQRASQCEACVTSESSRVARLARNSSATRTRKGVVALTGRSRSRGGRPVASSDARCAGLRHRPTGFGALALSGRGRVDGGAPRPSPSPRPQRPATLGRGAPGRKAPHLDVGRERQLLLSVARRRRHRHGPHRPGVPLSGRGRAVRRDAHLRAACAPRHHAPAREGPGRGYPRDDATGGLHDARGGRQTTGEVHRHRAACKEAHRLQVDGERGEAGRLADAQAVAAHARARRHRRGVDAHLPRAPMVSGAGARAVHAAPGPACTELWERARLGPILPGPR
jgi:hypothetical protein